MKIENGKETQTLYSAVGDILHPAVRLLPTFFIFLIMQFLMREVTVSFERFYRVKTPSKDHVRQTNCCMNKCTCIWIFVVQVSLSKFIYSFAQITSELDGTRPSSPLELFKHITHRYINRKLLSYRCKIICVVTVIFKMSECE